MPDAAGYRIRAIYNGACGSPHHRYRPPAAISSARPVCISAHSFSLRFPTSCGQQLGEQHLARSRSCSARPAQVRQVAPQRPRAAAQRPACASPAPAIASALPLRRADGPARASEMPAGYRIHQPADPALERLDSRGRVACPANVSARTAAHALSNRSAPRATAAVIVCTTDSSRWSTRCAGS